MVAAAGGRRRRGRETSAAAASCPLGHGAGRERQRREGEGEWRGSEWRGQGNSVLHLSTARRRAGERHGHWRPRGNEALQAVGHEHYCSSNFKISILPRKYKLKSHFPPIISPKPIDYLLHRLYRCVGLQEYSNFP